MNNINKLLYLIIGVTPHFFTDTMRRSIAYQDLCNQQLPHYSPAKTPPMPIPIAQREPKVADIEQKRKELARIEAYFAHNPDQNTPTHPYTQKKASLVQEIAALKSLNLPY